MKVVYHVGDLDGIGSAAILYWMGQFESLEGLFLGLEYGDEFPWEAVSEGEEVWMMDFCLQPFSEMEKLAEKCDLFWIDHHRTSIEEWLCSYADFRAVINTEVAAIELVWNEFCPEEDVPKTVRYLSIYDTWDQEHPWWDDALAFQMGMRAHIPRGRPESNAFSDGLWGCLLGFQGEEGSGGVKDVTQKLITKGKGIQSYLGMRNAEVAEQAFLTVLDGHECVAINGTNADNSKLFRDAPDAPVMVNFWWSGKNLCWVVELYTDRDGMDVSKIAGAHGGGGHPGAAGFQCDELPFEELW